MCDLKYENLALAAIIEYNRNALSGDFLKLILNPIDGWKLKKFWDNLPLEFQKMEELQKKLPCYEHYNLPGETHIDGPPPPKYRCIRCFYKPIL